MSSVTIGSDSFTIYGTMALANSYMNGLVTAEAATWNASVDTNKKARAMVTATKLLDRKRYIDEAETFALRDAIQVFRDACYEFACLLFTNPSLYSTELSGKNIKRVDAGGGVGVEFFVPTLGITGIFPAVIQDLIGQYLEGADVDESTVSGSFSSGTDGTETSTFSADADFNLNGPVT